MFSIKRISATTLAVGATLAISACAGTVEDPVETDVYGGDPSAQAASGGISAAETIGQTEHALGEEATDQALAEDDASPDEEATEADGEEDAEKVWRRGRRGPWRGGPGWHRGHRHWRGGPGWHGHRHWHPHHHHGWGWRGGPGWGWGPPPVHHGWGYGAGRACDPYYGCVYY